MGTYYIPRNLRGETRIFYFFTIKSLISTVCGLAFGLIFFLIFSVIGLKMVGIILTALCGFKIPTISGIPVTKKIGGEPVTEIITRWVKFHRNKKMYVYTKEEK